MSALGASSRNRMLWILPVLAILGAMGWYAYHQHWVRPRSEKTSRASDQSQADGMAGMDMQGMPMKDMPGMESAKPSQVAGHAKVVIPPEVQQRIGVTVGEVQRGPLRMGVQTVGIVQPNETKIARIHLRTEGWVEQLFVNFTGQLVHKGDPLLAIYSRDFVISQQEYLTARRTERHEGGISPQLSLAESARKRLRLLDVPEDALKKLEQTGTPEENITLRSPIDGTVLKKDVHEKDYVTADKELYVIADLSTVWVQAKVYEYELPHVELGQRVTVTIPSLPNQELAGKVVFIEPTVEERTRTVQVRIELPNEDGHLKPGMFAHINITHQMGEGLLAPTSAIIRTGEKDLAYRVASPGEFVPVEVSIDEVKFGDQFHVLDGLQAGDTIVTSANFLIDSESRLRAGAGSMAGMPGMEGMDMGNAKGIEKAGGKKGTGESKKDRMKGMDHSKMK